MRMHQYNCQKSAGVMHEFRQTHIHMGTTFALIQKPYCREGCLVGASGADMSLYGQGTAIVVVDSNFDSTVVSSSQCGLCFSVEWLEGKMLLASFYCRFSSPLEPYLRFMDSVLLPASSCPQILELYSNALYSLWFSKMSRHSYDHQKRIRGEMLVEWELSEVFDILKGPQI